MITEIIIKEPVAVTLTTTPPMEPIANVVPCDWLNFSLSGQYVRIEILHGNVLTVWYAHNVLIKYAPRELPPETVKRMMKKDSA